MKSRGQGTFEYVLLLGGVLLIVVLAVVLLRGGLFQSGSQDIAKQQCKLALSKSGFYDPSGVASGTCGTTAAYTCVSNTNGPQCPGTFLYSSVAGTPNMATSLSKSIPTDCAAFQATWTCNDGRA